MKTKLRSLRQTCGWQLVLFVCFAYLIGTSSLAAGRHGNFTAGLDGTDAGTTSGPSPTTNGSGLLPTIPLSPYDPSSPNYPAVSFNPGVGGNFLPADSSGPKGPSHGEPVDLGLLMENYLPEADLTVYNPGGPPVVWQRAWNEYQAVNLYGTGGTGTWTSNYDVTVQCVSPHLLPGSGLAIGSGIYMVFPNGGSDTIQSPGLPFNPLFGGLGSMNYAISAAQNLPYKVSSTGSGGSSPYTTINVLWKRSGILWQFKMVTQPPTGSPAFYRLTRIADRLGHGLNMTWTPKLTVNGQLVSSASDQLASVKDDNSSTLLSLNYTNGGYTASDCYGRMVTYSLTTVAAGVSRLGTVSQINSSGTARYTFTYYASSPYLLRTITVPSPAGTGNATLTFNYNGTQVSSVVDANGNSVSFSGSQNTLIQKIDSSGHVVATNTILSDGHHLTGIMDALGNTTTIKGSWSGWGYQPWPQEVDYPDGLKQKWTYDYKGNVDAHQDVLGNTTSFGWTTTSAGIETLTGVQVPNLVNASASYSSVGQLLSATVTNANDSNNLGTYSFTYDTLGNVLTATSPGLDSAHSRVTTFNYTTDGGFTYSASLGHPLTVTDNLGKVVAHYRYDSYGRLAPSTDALGTETDVTYDIADDPIQVQTRSSGSTNPMPSQTFSFQYPGGPLNSVQAFDENGNQVRQTVYAYGSEGELRAVSGIADASSYTYDGAYRISKVTDGNNNATNYSYDPAGRLASVTSPLNDTVAYPGYDSMGRLTKRIDGNGAITNYTYGGPANLLSAISYPASASTNLSLSYDSFGRVTACSNGSSSETYGYDVQSQLTSVSTTYQSQATRTIEYLYNLDGSRAGMLTPVGNFTYGFDGDGRLTSTVSPAGASSLAYLDNGLLATRNLPNGVSTLYGYNVLEMLGSVTNKLPGGSTLSSYGASFDSAFNISSVYVTSPSFGGSATYGYDTNDRLISENIYRGNGLTNSYGYDAAGNPTVMRGATQTFNANNQLGGSNASFGSGNNTVVDPVGVQNAYDGYVNGTYEQIDFSPNVPATVSPYQTYEWQTSTDHGFTWSSSNYSSFGFSKSFASASLMARVRGLNGTATGNWVTSTDFTYCAPPVAPDYIYIGASPTWSGTTETVQFKTSGGSGSSYIWQLSTDGGSTWTPQSSTTSTCNVSFNSGTVVTRVYAVNAIGYQVGPITSPTVAYVGNATAVPPSITLTAYRSGPTEILICDVSSNIPETYEIQNSLDGPTWSASVFASEAQASLTSGTMRFRARGITASGPSAWTTTAKQPYCVTYLNPVSITTTQATVGSTVVGTFFAGYASDPPLLASLSWQYSLDLGATWQSGPTGAYKQFQVVTYTLTQPGSDVRARVRSQQTDNPNVYGPWVYSTDVSYPGGGDGGPQLAQSDSSIRLAEKSEGTTLRPYDPAPAEWDRTQVKSGFGAANNLKESRGIHNPDSALAEAHQVLSGQGSHAAPGLAAFKQATPIGESSGRFGSSMAIPADPRSKLRLPSAKFEPTADMLASIGGNVQSPLFVYDANGNPTTYNGALLTFDPENRMTSFGSTVTYAYRPDNLRSSKTVGSTTTYYYYDGGVPLYETDSSGNVTAVKVFDGAGLVARQQAGNWTYYTFDQQGNVSERLDASANVVNCSYFDAYGNSLGATPTDPFGFNAQWGYILDAETGLYYCANRYYNPATGGWLTRDPIGFGGGINQYAYCSGGPMGDADPSGLMGMSDVGEGFSGVGGPDAGSGDESIGPPGGGWILAASTWVDDNLFSGLAASTGASDGNWAAGRGSGWAVVGNGTLLTGALVVNALTFERAGAQLIGSGAATKVAQITANRSAGLAAERAIASGPGKTVLTKLGRRVVDFMDGQIANEAKSGYTCLTAAIRQQIPKDSELILSGDATSVSWHFVRSSITGKIGPSKQLLDELVGRGFNVFIHY